MSLTYLNERYCARCNRYAATPYLRDNVKLFKDDTPIGRSGDWHGWKDKLVLDLGCGNMRNTDFLRQEGFLYVMPMDMAPGKDGLEIVLGEDHLPCSESMADVILTNYIFMFLNPRERKFLCSEINRVAAPHCMLMMELYASKHSFAKTVEETEKMKQQLLRKFKDWDVIRSSKERFILRKKA